MGTINLAAGWIGILLGFLSGAIQGMFFHKDSWLGGYSTWARRMIRLGHVSFFGLAFINLAYAVTTKLPEVPGNELSSALLVVGALTMPSVCYLSAFKKMFRHLFFVPVISLILGVCIFIGGVL